jgi:hypothetical protein
MKMASAVLLRKLKLRRFVYELDADTAIGYGCL